MFDRELVSGDSGTGDHGLCDRRDEGLVAELLARMDVADVDFDNRDLRDDQGVAQGHGSVGPPAGIDHDGVRRPACPVDAFEHRAFVIRLEEVQLDIKGRGDPLAQCADVVEGLVTVVFGLPRTEHVEVRSVEDQDDGCNHRAFLVFL